MDFSSDTSAPVHPLILEAIQAANKGTATSYGGDKVTEAVRPYLAEVLQTDAFEYLIVGSGTAANALALSVMCPPTDSILCHQDAHIQNSERSAVEFYTGGARLHLLPGPGAKIDIDAFEVTLNEMDRSFVHVTPPSVLSLTNLTESGCVYSASEMADLAKRAKAAGLSVHLDGARLPNALVFTGNTLPAMTWQAGIDVACFGLTKIGAMACEIILLFGPYCEKLAELKARAKRAGHLPPKMRFLAAQACALLQNDLWLDLARHANKAADRLSKGFEALGIERAHPTHGNEVFALLSESQVQILSAAGVKFYPWSDTSYRFVCSWITSDQDVDDLLALLRR